MERELSNKPLKTMTRKPPQHDDQGWQLCSSSFVINLDQTQRKLYMWKYQIRYHFRLLG